MKKFNIIAKCYDKKGRLLSIAENSYRKTHPYQKRLAQRVGMPQRIYLHAEIRAIIKAKANIHKIEIIRQGKHSLLKAKPCPICMEAINEAGIKVIEYSTEKGFNNEICS